MFANMGYEMAYCSPDGQISEVLEERNIQYFPLKTFSVLEIKKVIKSYRPSIIHSHDAAAAVYSSFANIRLPIVVHIHGNHMNMRKITIKSILVRFLSFRWRKIIWVSKSSYEDFVFKKSVSEKSIVLPNIILKSDIEYRLLTASKFENTYDCIVLGRINHIKNPLRAISIFREVVKQIPSLKVVFVGDGDLLEKCKQEIAKSNLSNNIEMIGYYNNPIRVLNNSKILIMTSIYEGTPMCALEAMALGKPIVSTPTDGIVDIIEQNVSGFYSCEDTQLVSKIINLIYDKKLYSQMSSEALKRFTKLMNIENYKSVLKDIYINHQ